MQWKVALFLNSTEASWSSLVEKPYQPLATLRAFAAISPADPPLPTLRHDALLQPSFGVAGTAGLTAARGRVSIVFFYIVHPFHFFKCII